MIPNSLPARPRCPAALMLCATIAGLLCSTPALALRPYEGTDASLAEPGVFELEFSPLGYIRSGPRRFLVAPFVVGNFDGDTKLVVEGKVIRQQGGIPDGYRTSLGDTMMLVKHLFGKGSLQDGTGLSIAAECGILLPELHGAQGSGATGIKGGGNHGGAGDTGAGGKGHYALDFTHECDHNRLVRSPNKIYGSRRREASARIWWRGVHCRGI
jgi:hypothetical protein